MGTLFDVTAGQLRAFEQHLDRAGFSAEAVQTVLREPAKAKELVLIAKKWLRPLEPKSIPEMIAPTVWNVIWNDATDKDWLDRLVIREKVVHKARGTRWIPELFIETARKCGREKIQEWERKFLLRFSALPLLDLTQDLELDWWKVRPRDWYYEQVQAGKIGRLINGHFQPDLEAFKLRGEIVLIDTRLRPIYLDGRQMWEDDELFCGKLLKQLREAGSIPYYEDGLQKSRFGVSADDWQDHIRPALAELIELESSQVRLERAIEGNAISQFYLDLSRVQDGTTNTWVWYEEYFESAIIRLLGGSDDVVLADVCCNLSGFRWPGKSFRPLAVLA